MKNILIKVLAFILIAPAFTGCLEDDKYALDPSDSKNTLEFGYLNVPVSPFGSVYPVFVVAFGVSEEDGFDVILNYAGANDNDQDIELTLEVDPVAVQLYNEQYGTSYVLLPEANYDMASMTVTIEKGKRTATLPVTVYPDQYDLSVNYLLPLKIASASHGTISSNFGTALFATVVKNRYDGNYTIAAETASMVDYTTADFVGRYPKNVQFLTVDGSTVDFYDVDYDLKGHIFTNLATGGASYYGGFAARIFFDNATGNVIKVENALGQGNNNRSGRLAIPGEVGNGNGAPAAQMTFDGDGNPVSMSIWYWLVQVSTDRSLFKETYEYVGPRD